MSQDTHDLNATRQIEIGSWLIFGFTDLGEVPIRGKTEPMQVWAVVRLKKSS
jgi:class 3 adenylate cyclase